MEDYTDLHYTFSTMIKYIYILLIILSNLVSYGYAGNWYVATDGTGQGTNGWEDATNDIQGAITACQPGYTVYVSNGYYTTNLVVGNGVTVRSKDNNYETVVLNGRAATSIDPAVKLGSNSWIIGMTISNGFNVTDSGGGGVIGGSISNCLVTHNNVLGGGDGGGIYNSMAYNSIIRNNFVYAGSGGGAFGSILYNCTVINNACGTYGGSGNGGGVCGSGWSYNSYVYNCIITGNVAQVSGGGGAFTYFYNCEVSRNSAASAGGVAMSWLYNCLVQGNTTPGSGGGSHNGLFYNCTVIDNTAGGVGGGGHYSEFHNSISWNNSPEDVVFNETWLTYSCGTGMYYALSPTCTTNNPMLTETSQLSEGSPCIGVANNNAWVGLASSRDLAGKKRIWPEFGNVDMGAYEYGSQVRYGLILGLAVRGGTIYNCIIKSNNYIYASGVYDSEVYNTVFENNSLYANMENSVGYNNLLINNLTGISNATLYNSILWNNTNGVGYGIFYNSCGPGLVGNNCITNYPKFINPTNNYRITCYSPCRDTGANFSWMSDTNDIRSKDLDNRNRIYGSFVDMGPYEYYGMPSAVINHKPNNMSIGNITNSVISWESTCDITNYVVYGGTTNIRYLATVTTTNFSVGPLNRSDIYSWRVDVSNNVGVATGTIWTFTVKPYIYQIMGVRGRLFGTHGVQY